MSAASNYEIESIEESFITTTPLVKGNTAQSNIVAVNNFLSKQTETITQTQKTNQTKETKDTKQNTIQNPIQKYDQRQEREKIMTQEISPEKQDKKKNMKKPETPSNRTHSKFNLQINSSNLPTNQKCSSFNPTPKSRQRNPSEKRFDNRGNEIKKKGNQKICFIDKISKRKLVEMVDIESYKAYNLEESEDKTVPNPHCCQIF